MLGRVDRRSSIGIDGRGPRRLAGRVRHQYLRPHEHTHLHDREEQQDDEGQHECGLDRRLTTWIASRPAGAARARRSQLRQHVIDHRVEQLGDLAGLRRPRDEDQRDRGRAEQHQRVLGSGLAAVIATSQPQQRLLGDATNTDSMKTPVGRASASVDSTSSIEAQRPEGAGEQGRDGERAEGGEDAQHEGKQQLDRHAPGRFFGAPPAIEASLAGETFECGQQSGAIPLGRHERADQRMRVLAGHGGKLVERVGHADAPLDASDD